MGNRAVLTNTMNPKAPAIYLHWNGGRASVEAFCDVAADLDIRGDWSERFDQLAEILAKHFFECEVGMTVYREPFGRTDSDNGDNGTYMIDQDWKIAGRRHVPKHFSEERDECKTDAIFDEIIDNYWRAK